MMNVSHLTYHCLRLMYGLRRWITKQLTPMGIGVLGVMLVSGLVGLSSSQSMSHLIFFLSLSLLGLAIVGRRFIQYGFRAERLLPRFGTVGEPLQYQVVLKNLTRRPQAGLKMVEMIPHRFPPLAEFLKIHAAHSLERPWREMWRQHLAKQQWAIASLIDLPVLAAGLKTEVTGEILPLRRGKLPLADLTLACPDPLGLSYQRVTDTQPQSLCILPKPYELPALYSSNARAYQMGDAVLTSSVGEALEFRSLRDYRPGDPTNKIHWKSWAKVGRPIVKEQQDESAVHHGLVLDTFHPEPQSDVFEEMLAIATSILIQENGDVTGLLDVIFATEGVRCLTVGQGVRQRSALLETMATMTPCETMEFDSLIPVVHSRLPRLSSCVCILLSWDEERHEFLKSISRYDVPIKTIVLCESHLNYVGLRYLSLSHSSTVHFISTDQTQVELLQL